MPSTGPDASSPDQRLRGAVREKASLKFVEAWLGWRGDDRLVPPRSAMEIADIRELLETVLLFEMNGPDEIRIKVAGSRLRAYADFEATGRSLKDVHPARDLAGPLLPHAGGRVLALRRGHDDARPQEHRPGVSVEGVTLPIGADEPGGSRLVITCLTALSGAVEPRSRGADR